MTFEKLKQFISEHYEIEADVIKKDSNFVTDLKLSSFQLIEMCALIEEEFGLEIEDEEMETLEEVGDVVRYLENKKREEI